MSSFNWFDFNWPWLGLIAAILLWVLLFGTNFLRNNLQISRWFDPVWLSWLVPSAYAIHNIEEYGIDALGQRFAFPGQTCAAMGLPPYPACSIPHAFYIAVNIPGIWCLGLACALLSRRHTLTGLTLYGILITNSWAHIGMFALTGQYNPGLLTAFLIQLPLSLWAGYAMLRTRAVRLPGIIAIIASGAALSLVLLISLRLCAAGVLGGFWMVLIQILNPLVAFAIIWFEEKREARNGTARQRA